MVTVNIFTINIATVNMGAVAKLCCMQDISPVVLLHINVATKDSL